MGKVTLLVGQLEYQMYYNRPDLPFCILRHPERQTDYFEVSSIKDSRFGYSGAAYVPPTLPTMIETHLFTRMRWRAILILWSKS